MGSEMCIRDSRYVASKLSARCVDTCGSGTVAVDNSIPPPSSLSTQVWRVFTNFFFFGSIGLDFFFHMFFLVRYCRLLEEGCFRGRTADFLYMIIFGARATHAAHAVHSRTWPFGSSQQNIISVPRVAGGVLLCAGSPFMDVPPFLGSSLAFMMVYVWGRRNQYVRMSFLGLFQFRAPYLPWVLLAFSVSLHTPRKVSILSVRLCRPAAPLQRTTIPICLLISYVHTLHRRCFSATHPPSTWPASSLVISTIFSRTCSPTHLVVGEGGRLPRPEPCALCLASSHRRT